jgi:Holliday junction resolvase RusA-like endonuclease
MDRCDQALQMLLAVLALRGALVDSKPLVMDFPGNPSPKARPRITSRGVYTPSQEAEQELAWCMKVEYGTRAIMEGPLALAMLFVRGDRRLVDLDNLAKLTKDSASGVIYRDDAQVEWEFSGIELGDDPRTVIAVAALPRGGTSRYLQTQKGPPHARRGTRAERAC